MKVDFDRGLLKGKGSEWLLDGWLHFHAADELVLMVYNPGKWLLLFIISTATLKPALKWLFCRFWVNIVHCDLLSGCWEWVSFRCSRRDYSTFPASTEAKALFDRVKDIILSIINVADYSERGLCREVFAFLTSFNAVSHNLSCSDPSRFCALWNRRVQMLVVRWRVLQR